ncbi:hypothetical protein KL86PLE_100009 [uncultured Pleomorphomonas sp.]|uniref:Uncharacterized protein n=1 Tax=uncultured Pleomorphomonas sp. TaxID=442121 RepID=A0A212L0P3_9HYPH|nr:hypothetical protein KL86PLE_100009 [uncultured Pleomorphomonas sp.]
MPSRAAAYLPGRIHHFAGGAGAAALLENFMAGAARPRLAFIIEN